MEPVTFVLIGIILILLARGVDATPEPTRLNGRMK
jgi:hypothetical protein